MENNMSAFLVCPSHIAAMAKASSKARYADETDPSIICARMAKMNFLSLDARYPDTGGEGFYEGTLEKYIKECISELKHVSPYISWVSLYKMVDCFAYQSCEHELWHSGYKMRSQVFNWYCCNQLKEQLVSEQFKDEFDKADWAYSRHKYAA
jgi:hypothetical protein